MALKIQLRRNQFEMSKHSVPMAIWLGKQYLGQKDQQEITTAGTVDETVKEMNEYFKRKRADFKSVME